MDWFRIVRISNVQTLRWMLGMVNGWDRPVALRQAQRWVSRMARVGYVDRTNLGGPGGTVVWVTPAVTGYRRPNLFAQTTRHEIAVSAASTRYLAAGYSWARDVRPHGVRSHVADGVAIARDELTLIEVELTPKRADRYVTIIARFRLRIEAGEADRVVYLCNPDSAQAVRAALRQPSARRIAHRVDVREVFDPRTAHWGDDVLPPWISLPRSVDVTSRIVRMQGACSGRRECHARVVVRQTNSGC